MCKDNKPTCCCQGHCHDNDTPSSFWKSLLPACISAALLLCGLACQLQGIPGLATYVLAYLPVAWPVWREAWEKLCQRDVFNEYTLMMTATLGAFAIGDYPEAVAVMLFYAIGEFFQDRATRRARRDIRSLVSLQPKTATVKLASGVLQSRLPEEVAPGETIVVKAGERVPLDGTLLMESADFDTAALTGEPLPRTLHRGDEVQAGAGLRATIGQQTVLVGKAAWLEEEGVSLPPEWNSTDKVTSVACAINGKAAGLLLLQDSPRPGAAEAVDLLRRLGVKRFTILSGDRSAHTAALAQQIGIEESYGDLLPADKVRRFEGIKQTMAKGKVTFVGDGINDAPVLALADVGIAIGGDGSDAAIETADVVLQDNRPSRWADAVWIARRTRRLVQFNISLALGVKTAVMLAAALGWAGL